MGRKLVTIETIKALTPIPGADRIEAATVRGWTTVTRKGEFTVGDPCLYFEVDSLLPEDDPMFEFLMGRGVRTDATGIRGHVLKTARFKGTYSQGLALPYAGELPEGTDMTEALSIRVWEPPIPASLRGDAIGLRPAWIAKTDEERIQNLDLEHLEWMGTFDEELWVATEKIDGSSMTVAISGAVEIVCSRNMNLACREGNSFWDVAIELDLHNKVRSLGGQRAYVQGELFGEGVQGNPLGIRGRRFALYNLSVDGQKIPRFAWPLWAHEMSVPVLGGFEFPKSVPDALAAVEGMMSAINPTRKAEGVVWRNTEVVEALADDSTWVPFSFKVVSNSYLLKHDR